MEIDSIACINFIEKEKINGAIDVRACNKPAGKVRIYLRFYVRFHSRIS